MISFRYHIVSIVAVFLALALGIVVGTTALNGPITKDLRNQVNDTKKQRDDLAAQNKALQNQVDNAGQFASTYGSQLVAKQLSGKSVVVVSLPGTSASMRDGITQRITAAGGKVGGQLTVNSDYLDSSRGNSIVSVATGPAHPVGLTLPETDDPGKLGGALLAYVLLGKGAQTDFSQVITQFGQLHMVTGPSQGFTPSTAIVVIGKGKVKKGYAGSAELSLVSALASAGGKVVVAGDNASATKNGLVSLVREQSADRNATSTIDDADTAFGQVSTVLALASALAGRPGHYGTGQGADSLFPSPTR